MKFSKLHNPLFLIILDWVICGQHQHKNNRYLGALKESPFTKKIVIQDTD